MVWRLDFDTITTKDPRQRIQLYSFRDGHIPNFVPLTFTFRNLAGESRSIQHQLKNDGTTDWVAHSSRQAQEEGGGVVEMTDGCGLISASAMREACEMFEQGDGRRGIGERLTPGAVQARILNAKGPFPSHLLAHMPDSHRYIIDLGVWSSLRDTPWSEIRWIEVRKWNAALVQSSAPLEILRVTQVKSKSKLGKQTFEVRLPFVLSPKFTTRGGVQDGAENETDGMVLSRFSRTVEYLVRFLVVC